MGIPGLKGLDYFQCSMRRCPKARNAVWCAMFQMAWNRLKDDVIGQPVQIANAESMVERLNKAVVTDDDLPDGSYYAAAGFTRDDTSSESSRWGYRMQMLPEKTDQSTTRGAMNLAYAYLRASVPFTLSFFENDKRILQFTDGHGQKTRVSSFGLRPIDESNYRDLRNQVDVLYLHRDKEWWKPTEFVLDPCRYSQPNQVIWLAFQRTQRSWLRLWTWRRRLRKALQRW